MSVLSRYRRTEDELGAAFGDESARLRLAAAGIHVQKLTPTTMGGMGRPGRELSPTVAMAGTMRYGPGGLDVGRHQDQFRHFAGHPYAIVRTIANRIAGQPLHHARHAGDGRPGAGGPPGKDWRGGSWRQKTRRIRDEKSLPLWLKNSAADLREYARSPILEAFRNPNPLMVQHTLVYTTIACLEVTGKGFWWLRHEDGDDDGDGIGGEPQIWYLPPHWMEPVHTPERLFASWKVRPGGGSEPFDLSSDEVVYFYYADMGNPLEAYSPFDALAQPIMANESIAESKRRSFLNSMAPSVAITIGQPAEASGVGAAMPIPVLSRPQRKALKSILLEEYRGTLNNGMPLILDGFIKDVKNLQPTPKELDFLNSSAATVQELNMGFGVNGISMGQVEGANRARSATADDHLCVNVVNPRLVMLSQIATRTMPRYFTRRTDEVVYWEPASSRDIEFDLKLEESMIDRGAMNRGEWRNRHGLPPIKDGEKTLVGGDRNLSWVDVTPLDAEDEKSGPGVRDPEGHTGEGKPANPGPAGPRTVKLIKGSTAARLGLKGVAESHDRVHRLYEERIRATAHELLTGLAGEYRERVAKMPHADFGKLHAVAALDRYHWERSLQNGLTPVIVEAAVAGAAHEWILAQNATARTKGFLPENLKNRVVKKINEIIGNGLFRRMVDAILRRIGVAVDKAKDTGDHPAAAAVGAVADPKAIADRAKEIGQTESQTAVGAGQHETFSTLRIMQRAGGRMWYSMKDSRVRATHERAHGQIVRGAQRFTVGGYSCDYPGDPTLPIGEKINCRCVVVVVE